MHALRRAAIMAASLTFAFTAPAIAQSAWPVDPGDYVEVSSIAVDDGHALEYLDYLSGQWRKGQDFAKAQGWITSYEILSNENKRAGEPDLFLVTRFASFADKAEGLRRDKLYMDHMKQTEAAMQAGSANRAKYRRSLGSMLLRAQVWNK